MASIKGINVPSTVVPFTDTDTYPVTDPIYGIGGWREVVDLTTRDAIPSQRLRAGMVVYVQGDRPYVWDGASWSTFKGWVVSPPVSSVSTGEAGTFAMDSTYLYICYATNQWARISYSSTSF